MNIDKSKLKIGLWHEDFDGNMTKEYTNSDLVGKPDDEKIHSYHVCFPLEVIEKVRFYYDNKDTCNHPLKYRKRTNGWVRGIKGCECKKCGKEKVGKSYIPFIFMPWSKGSDTYEGYSVSHHLSNFCQKCIIAMVNSGDYELDEAIVVMANSCERCMNSLLYKYLNGEDGYEEYSEEWHKANTVCDFCRGE